MPIFIFLHNYASGPKEGNRFVQLGKERIHHPLVQLLEYRFPAAPEKQSSAGRPVRLWYTLTPEIDGEKVHIVTDSVLLIESVAWLRGYINGLVAQGTPAHEIVLCGVRQGAGMAAAAIILLLEFQLGGVCMITSAVPVAQTLRGWVDSKGGLDMLENTSMPILLIHASNDMRVDTDHRRRLDRFYLDLGYSNYRVVEAMYLDPQSNDVTDGMWMFVWQFVIQTLGM